MIEISHVTKKYGEKVAVNDLTLTVEDGDIFGFIGHNGAGKTTLIKAIMGIHDFDEGEITINGISIKEDPIACKRKMAYLPDQPDLYENMTAMAYINFIADMYEVPLKKRTERIEKYAGLFEMKEVLSQPISSFSHGMKQKVQLIAALSHDPQVLILDEPFVGLDPKAVYDIKELMKQMAQEGKTIFFSTHILDVAEKLCNRIAIIKEGCLVISGTMEEVKGSETLENVFLNLGE